MKIISCVKWSLIQEVKNNEKICRHLENGVVVGYLKWSFTRGSNYRALTGKKLLFHPRRTGGRLWEVAAHGDSTVFVQLKTTPDARGFSCAVSGSV